MPGIKRIIRIPGGNGVFLDVSDMPDTGSVSVLSDTEIEDIRRSEREACARIADEAVEWCRSFGAEATAAEIARLIRRRSMQDDQGSET